MTDYDSDKIRDIHEHLHSHLPSDSALRVKALETLLVKKGLVSRETIDAWVQAYSEEIGPKRGATIVARAWLDDKFKMRLLEDAPAVVNEMGFAGEASAHLKVVENTDSVHNLVVCTLCSCYPFSILGIAPTWYKMAEYRSRAVRDPRGVLQEFGETLDDEIEVRVWDSTAELRYLVLPQRPEESDGMNEQELAELVTRNSMIGTQRTLAGTS